MIWYYDHPVALLVGRYGFEQVVHLPGLPAPPTWNVPLPPVHDFTGEGDDPSRLVWRRRRFALSRFTAPAYQWMEVYNDGRCQTPHPAFVYFETDLR